MSSISKINLKGTDYDISASKLKTARNITIGASTKAFDGTSDISFNLGEINTYPWKNTNIDLTGTDYDADTYYLVAVGGTDYAYDNLLYGVCRQCRTDTWSTHSSKTLARANIGVSWLPSGWGSNIVWLHVLHSSHCWTDMNPFKKLYQSINSSRLMLYIRGGGYYSFYTNGATPILMTDGINSTYFSETIPGSYAKTDTALTEITTLLSGYLPKSGGTMSGDITFPYNYGIKIATGTSWDDGFRSIPFSNVSDPSKIQWYSNNATTGLTFNANSGTLRTGNLITSGSTTSSKFIKSGGTSSQFLKADGSVDSNSYSLTSHTHTKSQITDFPASLKNPNSLTVKLNSGTTEGTNLFTYDGSAAKTVNITPSGIGAATSGHTHNYASTVKIGSTSYSVSSNTITLPAYPTAASLGLSSAMKFIGTTTTKLTDGATTNPITISSTSVTATSGNVVLYGDKEFLWNGSTSKWEELGDESSHALKTISIKAGTGLSGGGTLEADRTLSLSTATSSTLGGVKSATTGTTANRDYNVQVNSDGTMKVNVPWTDTYTQYPYGFSSRLISSWGNQTGTIITDWHTASGGDVQWMNDNPISGQVSLKVDGTVYINEGSEAVASQTWVTNKGYLTAHQDISGKADKASITAGTAGTSSATSGSSLNVPYVTVNTQGIVTGYGTQKHTISGFAASSHTHSQYLTSIPTASSSTLGGIKVGSNLSIDSNGVLSATNTTYTAGTNITISGTTISAKDTHYRSMNVITNSESGVTNTSSALTNGNVYLNHIEDGSNLMSSHNISGTGATTVTTDAKGNILINSTDTNTNTAHTHTAGTGLSISGSGGTSGGVTYTLNKATESTIGGVRVGKTITSTSGYIQCPVDSNGTIYYQDTNTNTTYSAGSGLSLSGTTFSLDSSKPNIMFGVCETAGATAAKVCIIKNGDINLNNGTIVNIFFKYANTAAPDQTTVSFTANADGSKPVNPMNMYSGYTSAAVAASPSYVDRVWGNIQFGTTYTFVIYNSKLYLLNDSNGAKAFNYCDTQITITEFLTNVLGHGGAMGSLFLKTAFSANNVTVSASRYYYIFLPYRDGVANSSSDDTIVRGCLILMQAYIDAANISGKTGYYVYIDDSAVQKVQQFLPVTTAHAYGRCSTAAGTAAKTVTVPNVTELVGGTEITVYFAQNNTASNVTLNVNNLGAKTMKKTGNTNVGSDDLQVGIYKLVYSGSYWFII